MFCALSDRRNSVHEGDEESEIYADVQKTSDHDNSGAYLLLKNFTGIGDSLSGPSRRKIISRLRFINSLAGEGKAPYFKGSSNNLTSGKETWVLFTHTHRHTHARRAASSGATSQCTLLFSREGTKNKPTLQITNVCTVPAVF